MREILTIGLAILALASLVACSGSQDNKTRDGNVELSPEQQAQLQPGADGDKTATPTAPETVGEQTSE